jgi:hypothetical protein
MDEAQGRIMKAIEELKRVGYPESRTSIYRTTEHLDARQRAEQGSVGW